MSFAEDIPMPAAPGGNNDHKQSSTSGFNLRPFLHIEGVREAHLRIKQKAESALGSDFPTSVNSIAKQLPLWPEDCRAIPNIFVRSALFNARNKNIARLYFENAEIYVIGDHGKITYTGKELRQDDETVWLQLIHLAKALPLDSPIEFTPYEFCKSLGWGTGGRDYSRLREILTRLQATSLTAYSSYLGKGVSLSMLPKFEWRDHASNANLKKYKVTIAEELLQLFGNNRYTRLEWEQRLSLSDGIATWLHGYFASHKNNFAIRLETIKQGCGIKTKNLKHLKETIETALKQLQVCGFITSYRLINGCVYVSRA